MPIAIDKGSFAILILYYLFMSQSLTYLAIVDFVKAGTIIILSMKLAKNPML
jgi:hypothetical protein